MFYRYRPRFFNAFRRAMTRPQGVAYPRLIEWALQTRDLVRAAIAAANEAGLDEATRRSIRLRVDRRDVSMETILAAVRYHAAEEYPPLLDHPGPHNLLVIQATNLNDRYLLMRLCQAEQAQVEPLQSRLQALRDHLDSLDV